MVPAFGHHWGAVLAVAVLFAVITIATMLIMVAVGHVGLRLPVFATLERHGHVLAGLTIAISGVAIKMLGI